jgi:hypothetical protein
MVFRPMPSPEDASPAFGRSDPVPRDYPFALTDKELKHVLRVMVNEIPGFDRYDYLKPELKLTLILIGALEQSRRHADRLGQRLFWAAVMALVVAVISLAVRICLRAG